MGPHATILVFWILSFKPAFPLSSFTLFGSSLLSAFRMVSSAYLRLLIFPLAILIPACESSSPVFCMMYTAQKLNKQDDNIHLDILLSQFWTGLFDIYSLWFLPRCSLGPVRYLPSQETPVHAPRSCLGIFSSPLWNLPRPPFTVGGIIPLPTINTVPFNPLSFHPFHHTVII